MRGAHRPGLTIIARLGPAKALLARAPGPRAYGGLGPRAARLRPLSSERQAEPPRGGNSGRVRRWPRCRVEHVISGTLGGHKHSSAGDQQNLNAGASRDPGPGQGSQLPSDGPWVLGSAPSLSRAALAAGLAWQLCHGDKIV